jgi:hypothetical protein
LYATTWKMDSHSLCKLKALSQQNSPFFYSIQTQNPSLFLILTQCPFSCLVWAHILLETSWKEETMKDSRFMKWNNCIN